MRDDRRVHYELGYCRSAFGALLELIESGADVETIRHAASRHQTDGGLYVIPERPPTPISPLCPTTPTDRRSSH